jgi:hypothetical protein
MCVFFMRQETHLRAIVIIMLEICSSPFPLHFGTTAQNGENEMRKNKRHILYKKIRAGNSYFFFIYFIKRGMRPICLKSSSYFRNESYLESWLGYQAKEVVLHLPSSCPSHPWTVG